jgi:oxalate---CoA ligase
MKTNIHNIVTLYETINYHAMWQPDNVVITAPKRNDLTFKALKDRVDEIASILGSGNANKKLRIAIIMPNGPEMAVAFLAVSSFAAAAPLNPQYKASDLEFYLADLKADILLIHSETQSAAREVAQKMAIPVLEAQFDLDKPAGFFTLSSNEQLPTPGQTVFASASDTALFLHTSGTTSRPKLVPLTQKNLCTSASNIVNTLDLKVTDRCLNIMPLFHIHGLMAGLFASIKAGGSVACSPDLRADSFFDWLKELKPTWYTGVPTMHQAILAGAHANIDSLPPHQLRFIRSSSSALAPQVMSVLEETFKVPVIESYGMTEAAHQMASNPLPPEQRKPGSVGKPAGPQITILDPDGNELKGQQAGEIAISGNNVTAGYENNPEANKTAFTNGWFRTGDLGYFDESGYLFVTGRLKEIINRGGEKISPREIDEVLLDHPLVKQAVAFSVPHPTLGEDLVAAVVIKDDSKTNAQVIRRFLFENLPGFKVPSQIILLEEIPKGSTGKLQRIGLAEKLSEHFAQTYVAPSSEIEIMLAENFAQLLKLPQVGINENFFALGGDSLLATQLITRIGASLFINMPIVTVFQAPTIAELALEVSRCQTEQWNSASMLDVLAQIETLPDENQEKSLRKNAPIQKQKRN